MKDSNLKTIASDHTDTAFVAPHTSMRVKKRDGSSEPVDLNKILRAVSRCCENLPDVDAMRVATKTISGLYDGATTRELDQLSIKTASDLIASEPSYALLAARLLSATIQKEVAHQDIESFSQSVGLGRKLGLINERLSAFVTKNARKLNAAIVVERDSEFEYFGIRTVYDRYLLKHPQTRQVIETPQQFFMRIACALSENVNGAIELYGLFSTLSYLPSSPTLFNAGCSHEQLSSCFLVNSPQDDLIDIYKTYSDIARLSKFSGGIGVSFSRVRSRGSLIKSTNGHSNGITPWLKTLDSSIAAVNQGGKRKGACAVYLPTWHADVEAFLELRDNTGDQAQRTHNLNLANWVPDLFMKRVEADGMWSLFDPKTVTGLEIAHGLLFEVAYEAYEAAGLAVKQVKARDLYARMMRTLTQAGQGWMTWQDAANRGCNQVTSESGCVVHLSNLCTEILEVTSDDETAVCNLGSINLARHVVNGVFDFKKLAKTVAVAMRQLDAVIDINLYTIPETSRSNEKWRPVGLGIMGLQDVFFQLGLSFDCTEARELSKCISEAVYFHALTASMNMAREKGPHTTFGVTKAAKGELQFDSWKVEPSDKYDWQALRNAIIEHGLRNSLMIAIAPTATIASIAGCFECIEPQVSNLFKRETMSGDFIQINKYLIADLKKLGMWNESTLSMLKLNEGSAQALDLPAEMKLMYRTAWEMPMRSLIDMAADRGAFIDQSQSLNLFMESPTIGAASSMYMYAWKRGLKTSYYLRSRPATRIAKSTVSSEHQVIRESSGKVAEVVKGKTVSDEEAISCSLENPEACEACQ